MKKFFVSLAVIGLCMSPMAGNATDLKAGEKAVFDDMKAAIPADKIKTIDDLYAKWQEAQTGKSNAKIIDIRTEAEFEEGHILNSSNVDSGHAYGMIKKITDPSQEIWIFCRTKHRATYFTGLLYKYGFTNVYIAEGGIKAWAEKGYPLYNTYLGEIKVTKYNDKLSEEYWYRENK
ncbi:MAG: rhodanese-like domain-containing protein [Pseudomonadota bacterium]